MASPMAAASTRLPVASREISSERRIGTPLCSSVPSTRQKRATANPRKIGAEQRQAESNAILPPVPRLGSQPPSHPPNAADD